MGSEPTEHFGDEARRQPGWIGRDERTQVQINALAQRSDESQLQVVVNDMSLDGCRIECADTTLEIGEWLELHVPGFEPVQGQVRWALLGSAGLRFEE
jgi:hypothetical protein